MSRIGSATPLIGRDVQREHLVQRLLTPPPPYTQMPVVICGMTGIGKSALAAAAAQDQRIQGHFKDGVFSVSLGQRPEITSILNTWAARFQLQPTAFPVEALSLRLNARLSQARVLFILDDVWDMLHVYPLLLGGYGCRILVTTRLYSLAQLLAVRGSDIIRLQLLTQEQREQFLRPFTSQSLEAVEGLPLLLQALRVMFEENSGSVSRFQFHRLLDLILEANPPSSYALPANEPLNNIAALYRRTVARMPERTFPYLRQLGRSSILSNAFDLASLQALWRVADAKPLVRELVDYSVLELLGGGWFYISALMKAFLNHYL